ncbi:MAG: hypothetical protein JST06_08050 [Bacteroidetes bacterium]|nr:hypothetical protein [Bacteroidota bacterium]MBS1630724.1 hypothetical protein [Bacteroidota bacterium]
MKFMLFVSLFLLPATIFALPPITVAKGHVVTAPGIGGYADLGLAFAKGDIIHIQASAEKRLSQMIVLFVPNRELGRVSETEHPHFDFKMPQEGIVVFRFISDRSGTDRVDYTVTRTPASPAAKNYDSRVVWLKPANGQQGDLIPVRANSHYDKSRVVTLIE